MYYNLPSAHQPMQKSLLSPIDRPDRGSMAGLGPGSASEYFPMHDRFTVLIGWFSRSDDCQTVRGRLPPSAQPQELAGVRRRKNDSVLITAYYAEIDSYARSTTVHLVLSFSQSSCLVRHFPFPVMHFPPTLQFSSSLNILYIMYALLMCGLAGCTSRWCRWWLSVLWHRVASPSTISWTDRWCRRSRVVCWQLVADILRHWGNTASRQLLLSSSKLSLNCRPLHGADVRQRMSRSLPFRRTPAEQNLSCCKQQPSLQTTVIFASCVSFSVYLLRIERQ